MVGLDNVDQATIEAGRGIGMTKWQALTRMEVPLAVPVIFASMRSTAIVNIGMATFAFLIGGRGLGIAVDSGLKLQRTEVFIVGAVMVAIVALTFAARRGQRRATSSPAACSTRRAAAGSRRGQRAYHR